VWSGRLAPEDTVRILPVDRVARVRGIQGHGSRLDAARPGARTAIALAGVDVPDVPRGSTIVTDREWHPTTLARADVSLVPGSTVAPSPRTWLRLHVGTTEVGARVVARNSDRSYPFAARLVLDEPVLLRAGDRFVLRTTAPLNTIGGGVITDPYAPRRARPWPPSTTPSERLRLLVEESGGRGVEASALPVRLGLSMSACRAILDEGRTEHAVVAGRAVSRAAMGGLEQRALAAVGAYHAANPLEPGMPTQLLRARLPAIHEVAEAAVKGLLDGGSLEASGGSVRVAGWTPVLGPNDAQRIERLAAVLEGAGSEPPSTEELSADLGTDAAGLLRYMERRGDIVQVEQNRYYTAINLKSLIERLRVVMRGGAEIGPSEIRDALGLSRKYLIPFLEYCDRVGYTNRRATGRVWRGT
jgi:selenocysteine-specific elongation factor